VNKFIILAIVLGIISVGIIATMGIGSDFTISEIPENTSQTIATEDKSEAKHFSASMTETIGVTVNSP